MAKKVDPNKLRELLANSGNTDNLNLGGTKVNPNVNSNIDEKSDNDLEESEGASGIITNDISDKNDSNETKEVEEVEKPRNKPKKKPASVGKKKKIDIELESLKSFFDSNKFDSDEGKNVKIDTSILAIFSLMCSYYKIPMRTSIESILSDFLGNNVTKDALQKFIDFEQSKKSNIFDLVGGGDK